MNEVAVGFPDVSVDGSLRGAEGRAAGQGVGTKPVTYILDRLIDPERVPDEYDRDYIERLAPICEERSQRRRRAGLEDDTEVLLLTLWHLLHGNFKLDRERLPAALRGSGIDLARFAASRLALHEAVRIYAQRVSEESLRSTQGAGPDAFHSRYRHLNREYTEAARRDLGGKRYTQLGGLERRRRGLHRLVRRLVRKGVIDREQPALVIGPRWASEVAFLRHQFGLRRALGLDLVSDDPRMVIVGDMHAIPLRGDCCGFVYSRNTINYAHDIRLLVAEIIRVATDGCVVALSGSGGYHNGPTPMARTDFKSTAALECLFHRVDYEVLFRDEGVPTGDAARHPTLCLRLRKGDRRPAGSPGGGRGTARAAAAGVAPRAIVRGRREPPEHPDPRREVHTMPGRKGLLPEGLTAADMVQYCRVAAPIALRIRLRNLRDMATGRRKTDANGGAGQAGAVENSGFCWVKEGPNFHTRVYVRNYWTANYQVAEVRLQCRIYSAAGALVHRDEVNLGPEATFFVDTQDLARQGIIPQAFEGNVVVSLRDPKLRRVGYIQTNVDCYDDAGTVTTVHGQGALVDRPIPDIRSHYYLPPQVRPDAFIVLQNPYRYTASPQEFLARFRLEVYNAQGDRRVAHPPPVPSCGAIAARLMDYVPDLQAFLRGAYGSLRVRSNVRMHRPPIFVAEQGAGFPDMYHGNSDRSCSEYRRLPAGVMGRAELGPVLSTIALEQPDLQIRFLILNDFYPLRPYTFWCRLFSAEGRPVGEIVNALTVAPGRVGSLTLGQVLDAVGIRPPFAGHILFGFARDALHDRWGYPRSFVVGTELRRGGRAALVETGSEPYNLAAADPVLGWIPKRTNVFSRALLDPQHETWVGLINAAASLSYATPSDTTLHLYDLTGKGHLERRISLPAWGMVWESLRALFPQGDRLLAATRGHGMLVVRDSAVRLVGFQAVEQRELRTLGIDHLFGG